MVETQAWQKNSLWGGKYLLPAPFSVSSGNKNKVSFIQELLP
jgi:hypothetical protein